MKHLPMSLWSLQVSFFVGWSQTLLLRLCCNDLSHILVSQPVAILHSFPWHPCTSSWSSPTLRTHTIALPTTFHLRERTLLSFHHDFVTTTIDESHINCQFQCTATGHEPNPSEFGCKCAFLHGFVLPFTLGLLVPKVTWTNFH